MHYELRAEELVAYDEEHTLCARIGFKPLAAGKIWAVEHTWVTEAMRGHNLAASITEHLFDHVKQHGITIIPLCRYTQLYVKRHPQTAELLYNPPAL